MKKLSLIVPLAKGAKPEFLDKMPSKLLKDLEVIIVRGPNPSRNRNLGAKKARFKYLAFINGHTLLSEDWLDKVISFFNKHLSIDIVGGPQHNSKDEGTFGRISGYALASPFGSGGIWRRYGGEKTILDADETMLTSANLICKKKVFKKIKFDESIYPGEDPKFIAEAKKAGFKIAYSPEIIAYNRRRSTPIALFKQVFNYGRVRPQKEDFSETLKRPFFLIPSVFFLYLISLSLYNSWFYLIPLWIYIILCLSYSVYFCIKYREPSALFISSLVFFVVHLSYGLGFITGLVSRLFKGKKK